MRQAPLALYLQQILPQQPTALGLFMGLDGLGAVMTSIFLSRRKEITHYGFYFFAGFLLLGFGILGVGIYHTTWSVLLLYGFAVIIGLGTGVLLVTYGYLIKKETPKEQMGRVSGASATLQNCALATGTLLSGFFVLHIGLREMYLATAAIMGILALLSGIFMDRLVGLCRL